MKRKGIIIFSSSALIFIILSAVSVFQSGSLYAKSDDGVIIELETREKIMKACMGFGLTEDMIDIP